MPEYVSFPVQFTSPLGGAVTQAFTIAPQFGLFNVQLGSSRDAPLERQIIDRVGSYGRQLGRISEALGVLINRMQLLERDDLSHRERGALLDLLRQVEAVAELKEARSQPLSAGASAA